MNCAVILNLKLPAVSQYTAVPAMFDEDGKFVFMRKTAFGRLMSALNDVIKEKVKVGSVAIVSNDENDEVLAAMVAKASKQPRLRVSIQAMYGSVTAPPLYCSEAGELIRCKTQDLLNLLNLLKEPANIGAPITWKVELFFEEKPKESPKRRNPATD